jgi:polyphosphate kinase
VKTTATAAGKPLGAPNLDHRTYYINREVSWLRFNERVLEEALDTRNPLLERAKFLSIFHSNLDEFFMVRVSGLRRQLAGGVLKTPADGMTPAEQLAEIRSRLKPALTTSSDLWTNDLQPKLSEADVRVLDYEQLKKKQRKLLRKHFKSEIFPALTPLAFDPGHPFPHISNLCINLAVEVNDPQGGERFARIKVPPIFDRLLSLPSEEKADSYERLGLETYQSTHFVWIEQVIAANLDLLFPGMDVVACYPFRVTRDADFEIEEDEASDLLSAMLEVVEQRHFGSAVRLEVDNQMPEPIRDILTSNLELQPYQVFALDGPLGLADVMELMRVERPELKDKPYLKTVPSVLGNDDDLFSTLRKRNVLLYHPFDSFNPVIEFINQAANDPDVLAIKQTLYRVGPNSPVVKALMQARENGKQVAAIIELKARFDEENNIGWARALERAGVHVVYGLVGLKIHSKMCLVVRREASGIQRYVHLGTGNYNPVTARVYTDLGYFTTDPEIAADVSDLFNVLTGYSHKQEYSKLLVSPVSTRSEILSRIDREIERHKAHGDGYLAFKVNSLADKRSIKALYRASMAGVKVDLQVRGICCLRPGVARVSENITVTSVVGRFLEHTRIFYFRNGGDEEVFLGSADLMPRNLNGRVEVTFPVEDERLRTALRDEILFLHLHDNVQARRLLPDATYERLSPGAGEEPLSSQALLCEGGRPWHLED